MRGSLSISSKSPDVDLITGLPPSVAIEQRITRGGRQIDGRDGDRGLSFPAPDVRQARYAVLSEVRCGRRKADHRGSCETCRGAGQGEPHPRVVAPLVKARKGFLTVVAKWAEKHGFEELLVDGKFMPVEGFEKLDRFKEHTIDVLIGEPDSPTEVRDMVKRALEIGKGTARLLDARKRATVLSTEMSCPLLRPVVRGTRSAPVFLQLAARLVRRVPRLWRGLESLRRSASWNRPSRSNWTRNASMSRSEEGEARALPELRTEPGSMKSRAMCGCSHGTD